MIDPLSVASPSVIDLTSLVRDWIQEVQPQHGVRLRSNGSNGQTVAFYSANNVDLRPQLEVTYVQPTRLGVDPLWTYVDQSYGNGITSQTNIATSNTVVQHPISAIPARGFSVDLTLSYNAQDPFGLNKAQPDAGAFYGEGWSLSQDVRLRELDGGNAVVFRDGTGGTHRVYVKDVDSNGTRSYLRPLFYGATLTKDLTTPPADPAKVYTLTSDSGGLKHFFDAEGKRTRQEDRNGNSLSYSYDSEGRLTTITDVAGRQTTLIYYDVSRRLKSLTDMAGRVTTFRYTADGNLDRIKQATETPDELLTYYSYYVRDHLTTVKPPHGFYSSIVYYTENGWEASNTGGWSGDAGPVTVEHSTAQAYRGTGSLKVNLSGISTTTSARIARSFDPPKVRAGLMPSDLILYLYVPTGAPALLSTVTLQYEQGTDTFAATSSLTAGQWNELRVSELRVGQKLAKMALQFRTAVDGQSYTGPVYVDQLFYKGITDSLKDAEHQVKTVDFSHDWATQTITVKRLDPSGTYRGFAHTYDRAGQVTNITDPLGNATTMTYDDDQRLEQVQAPDGGTSTLTYYPERNDVHTATSPANETTRQGVDTTTSDPCYTLDARNEKRRADGLDFVATVYTHDSAGNTTQVQVNRYAAGTNLEQTPLPAAQATLRTTSYTYGPGGVMTSLTDPMSRPGENVHTSPV